MPDTVISSLWKDVPLPDGPVFRTYLPRNLERPELNAFVDAATGRAYTRLELREKALRLALGLKKAVPRSPNQDRQGKRLAVVFSPNSIDYPLVFFGCQASMSIVSLANAGYTYREFIHQLVDGKPDFLFVHPNLWSTAKKSLAELAQDSQHAGWVERIKVYSMSPRSLMDKQQSQDGLESFEDLFVAQSQVGSFDGDELGPDGQDQTAVLCYSSGTVSVLRCGETKRMVRLTCCSHLQTGLPKGVETTHRNLNVTAARASVFLPQVNPDKDAIIGVLPYYRTYSRIRHDTLLHWIIDKPFGSSCRHLRNGHVRSSCLLFTFRVG